MTGRAIMETIELAEQFFLISHDEFSGKPAVSHELVECGLVGAMFGGLVIEGRLGIKEGKVVVLDGLPGNDELTNKLVRTVDQQPTDHRIRIWAEQLGGYIYPIVAERLVQAGTLRRDQARSLLGRSADRYPAVDLYHAARPRLLLNHVIRHREEMDLDQAVVIALLAAVGIEGVLGLDLNRDVLRSLINSLVNAMPTQLQELMTGIDETVASISLTIHH
jgi:Golgi phosphoprotein 3 (GPP34)